jgi:hypothetical protein
VALLQGLDAALLRTQAEDLVRALAPVAAPVCEPQAFELQTEVRREDLLHPLARRQPARTDLQQSVAPGDSP